MYDHEVADSDRADLAAIEQRLQGAVGLEGSIESRGQRLVQDQKVDLVDTELAGALLECMQRLVVSVIADPDLGLQEDLRPVHVGAVDRLADLALIAVSRRGVDVPVPGAECTADGVPGLVGGCLENPQTEGRNLDAVVESDRFHLLPSVDDGPTRVRCRLGADHAPSSAHGRSLDGLGCEPASGQRPTSRTRIAAMAPPKPTTTITTITHSPVQYTPVVSGVP